MNLSGKSFNDFKSALLNKRMLICIFNGFSAGLPLYFIYSYIPAWLRSEGVNLKTIGLFSLVGIPYAYKFMWAPAMDRYTLSLLGRRRSWMILSQILLFISMASLSLFDPQKSIMTIAYIAAGIAFFSATQDIALDAYRRELLPDNELGLGNSFYMNAYRISGLVPGSLGLIWAESLPWSTVHIILAFFMFVGIIKTLTIKEIDKDISPPKTLRESVVEPFKEFFNRDGIKQGLFVLAFLFLYKIGDNMATALSTAFYLDVGFTLTQIGTVAKLVSLWAMIVGGFIGGLIIFKIGINKSLFVFGIVQMITILGFAVLNEAGAVLWVFAIVVGLEYLGVGLGATAMAAFMARSSNKNFTGTQLALFTSFMALPRTFANSITGFLVEGIKVEDKFFFHLFGALDGMGYTNFFLFCTVMAIPGMILLKWVAPWSSEKAKF